MLAAQQLVEAGQAGVDRVLRAVAAEVAHEEVHAFARDRIGIAAAGRAQQGTVLAAFVVGRELELPVVREPLLQRHEQVA
ncbi:hypothetical protein D3C72_2324630 [compost metagenome]